MTPRLQRGIRIATVAALLGAPGIAGADGAARDNAVGPGPATSEQVEVNLFLVETLALDRRGRTVPDLSAADFRLTVDGESRPIDTFDRICPEGAADDPLPLRSDRERPEPAAAVERKLVLVFDYYHLDHPHRFEVLERAIDSVLPQKASGESVMLVALANGLRIEESFTMETAELHETLTRMQQDVTLFAGTFEPITERSFFENLAELMDVLAEYEGPKAVVLYTMFLARAADSDLWFRDVAQRAAAARTVIYPMWAGGLEVFEPTGGSPALARLANESGGRFTRNTNDLSLAYARAQRDLSCRYVLGFYVDAATAESPRTVHVRPEREGLEVRAPEQMRRLSDEQRQVARTRAALANPERHQDSRYRLRVWPLRPASRHHWETVVAVELPPDPELGGERSVKLQIQRGTTLVEELEQTVTENAGNPGELGTTLWGAVRLKSGEHHRLTVVVTDVAVGQIRTARLRFTPPVIATGELDVRGPVTDFSGSRALLFDRPRRSRTRLNVRKGLRPLFDDGSPPGTLTAAWWYLCAVAGPGLPPEAVLDRQLVTADGAVLRRLLPRKAKLRGRGPIRCQSWTDELDTTGLPADEYRIELAVRPSPNAPPVAEGDGPLRILNSGERP